MNGHPDLETVTVPDPPLAALLKAVRDPLAVQQLQALLAQVQRLASSAHTQHNTSHPCLHTHSTIHHTLVCTHTAQYITPLSAHTQHITPLSARTQHNTSHPCLHTHTINTSCIDSTIPHTLVCTHTQCNTSLPRLHTHTAQYITPLSACTQHNTSHPCLHTHGTNTSHPCLHAHTKNNNEQTKKTTTIKAKS